MTSNQSSTGIEKRYVLTQQQGDCELPQFRCCPPSCIYISTSRLHKLVDFARSF